MHLDPRRGEPVDLLHDAPRLRILHQPDAHPGIGGVDRHVHGRESLVDDALELSIAEIGERDEVPVDEREDVVVVLDQELAPHPLGVLVHEAEDAVVVAALGLAGFELRAEGDAVLPEAAHGPFGPVLSPDEKRELLLRDLRAEVDLVVELDTVDLEDPLARGKTEAGSQPRRVDRGDGEGIAQADHGCSSSRRVIGKRGIRRTRES